jgi:hypothetical protein
MKDKPYSEGQSTNFMAFLQNDIYNKTRNIYLRNYPSYILDYLKLFIHILCNSFLELRHHFSSYTY